MDEDFIESVCNKWVGCEFFDCGKWWYEICFGLTFIFDKERDKYIFVCFDYDTRDFFGDKVIIFSDDKYILNLVDDILEKKRRRLFLLGELS